MESSHNDTQLDGRKMKSHMEDLSMDVSVP